MRTCVLGLFVVACCLVAAGQSSGAQTAATFQAYSPVHNFDAKRDAAADIKAAIAEAQRTGKRIILDIGGDWCPYCHQMDKLFHEHPELVELRDKYFLLVDIYYGPDKPNRLALSRYSKLLGVPHFFVLESDGTLLFSQHVFDLRSGGKYDPEKMKAFLLKWAPAKTAEAAK